jgi:hypothetical protein
MNTDFNCEKIIAWTQQFAINDTKVYYVPEVRAEGRGQRKSETTP